MEILLLYGDKMSSKLHKSFKFNFLKLKLELGMGFPELNLAVGENTRFPTSVQVIVLYCADAQVKKKGEKICIDSKRNSLNCLNNILLKLKQGK